MDPGVVQDLLAFGDSQEAGGLLIGLGPQTGNLQNLFSGGEGTVFLPVGDDVLCNGAVETGDPAEKRGRSSVEVHAHGIDAVLHHAAKGFIQPLFRQVVLILPHTDGLGVDFDQLRQRVLEPSCNGDSGPEVYIVLGKFLRRQLGGGIDGGPCLGDNHIADALHMGQKLADHVFRLPGGGAVADGNVLHMVFIDEAFQRGDGLLALEF